MTDEFIIPLNGLKPGKTSFSWHAGTEFFRKFGNAEIVGADIDVKATVEKSGSYLGIDCELDGQLTVPCDRCLEDVTLPVSADAKLSVKFGEEPASSDETVVGEDEREVVYLPDDGSDMDMSQTIYDFAYLSLPMQRVHEEGRCNPDAVRYLHGGSVPEKNEERDDTYSPFAVLKGLGLDKKEHGKD